MDSRFRGNDIGVGPPRSLIWSCPRSTRALCGCTAGCPRNSHMKERIKRTRRSIRLKEFDYSRPGAYFVTVCVNRKECLLGAVADGRVIAGPAGRMVQTVWEDMPRYYYGIEVDVFALMPNHIHGIIMLVGATPRGCPASGQAQGPAPTTLTLPDVVHRFKSLTTAHYRTAVAENGWRPFRDRFWQRNYYEHVIRSEDELDRVRQYILENPLRWDMDRENPNARNIDDKEPWEI